jgi:hypothetical protein
MIFGNKSIALHLLRGVSGFAALAVALSYANEHLWVTILFMPLALWMLKGCPICWLVGFFESVAMKLHKK